jgi:ABC-type nitrate/sulfonate/bicarbonate transport system permease component
MTATTVRPRLSSRVNRSYGARIALAAARTVGTALLAAVVILALWAGALIAFDVAPFVGKGPLDVFNYLFTVPVAAENREHIAGLLAVSLVDASIGFCAGLAAALVIAAVFVLVRSVEHALMPVALLLQAVPLIALAPIIILIFGRGTATTAVMGGLVVLFPALVTIVFGLRSASPAMIDLVRVYGGGPATSLLRVALPSALPAFFAAVKISVPGAITGALIAEWLATGQGIGRAIVSAIGQAKMNEVWALGVVITGVSIGLYMLAGLIESIVLERTGTGTSR